MPVDKVNFYENQNEASMRLRRTIVMYEGEPYYVIGVTDHKNDGKLRIYLDKLGYNGIGRDRNPDMPDGYELPPNMLGPVLDEWIDKNPNKGVIRKFLGAAGFNKFRPFPLGNMNVDGQVIHVERTPTRNTFQGLRGDALIGQIVSVAPNRDNNLKPKKTVHSNSSYGLGNLYPVEIFSPVFYDCIMGNYPTFNQVMMGLNNPEVINTGVAFHRDFSVLRGPFTIRVLCYKTEGVGLIEQNGLLFTLNLSKKFSYLKETLEELTIFYKINIVE